MTGRCRALLPLGYADRSRATTTARPTVSFNSARVAGELWSQLGIGEHYRSAFRGHRLL
ncbi:MAG: hypothetical protein ACR2QO_09620 [Acidimicrobiales bacterium]